MKNIKTITITYTDDTSDSATVIEEPVKIDVTDAVGNDTVFVPQQDLPPATQAEVVSNGAAETVV